VSYVRYAVPVSDDKVSSHFGHCRQFAFFDVNEQGKEILSKKLISSPGHEPGLLPRWLAEQDVSLVIASGMGSRARSLFQQNHVGVVIGTLESDPEKAVLSYLHGRLGTGSNICDH
jgi:ATP-binding protein involved in chromosome partitioning